MATQYFYVTRAPGGGFVATLTLSQVRAGLATGELQESFNATESDGRSFTQFQADGAGGRWRTLAELLAEQPRAAPPPPATQEVRPVPLMDCPACGRKISTEAEACPQCGHPTRLAARAPAGPKCYACSAAATTRCQRCGALSCATHLQPLFVAHGEGGGYELRCANCYASAMTWKVVGCVFAGIILFIMLAVFTLHGR